MKKFIPMSFSTVLSVGVMTTVSILSLENSLNQKSNSKAISSNKLYSNSVSSKNGNINDQVNGILNSVTQKTYLGDIEAATNHGDLTSIDVSKLIDLDNTTGQIIPAYLKVDGKFTSDINEAKRSHLQNPIIKYLDSNGNVYDTEIEAFNAMVLNEENYSNGIAYYEIQDLSDPNKPTYNINPLNKMDVDKLKELAYANAGVAGSHFDVMRLKSDNINFNKSDFVGLTSSIISNKVNNLVNDLIQIVYDNSLFSIINSYQHVGWIAGSGLKSVTSETIRDYYGVSDSALSNLYDESIKELASKTSNKGIFDLLNKIHAFQLSVSQQNFGKYDMATKANQAYDLAYNKVMSVFNNNTQKQTIAQNVANMVKSVVGNNFLGNNRISTEFRENYEDARKILKGKVLDTLKSQFNLAFTNSNTGFTSINDYLTSNMIDVFQEDFTKNGDNVKYAITYNGSPLFLINNTIMTNIKDQESFRANPTSGIKTYFFNSTKTNGNWRESAKSGLINISNTYSYDTNKNLVLTKENLLTNYNTDMKYSNFQFSSSNPSSGLGQDVKLVDENLYVNNNIDKNNLEKQLNRREDENKSLLNSPYGTIEAIYQYNKTLEKYMQIKEPTQGLIGNVNNNRIVDTNDVVFLYNSNKSPATIKYGKYANYGTKFNVSLTDDSNRVISSTEALASEFKLENLGVPTKQYNFYDYSGKLISSELINSVNGDFNESEKNAWENALKKIDVQANNNYVFFKESDKETLVKNEITKLYVCYIPSNSTQAFSNYSSFNLRAESTTGTYYGFTSYDDLKVFVENYVNTVNGILPPLITPNPPVTSSNAFYREVLISTWSSLGIIIILAGVSSLYFYNISSSTSKLKTKNSKHKYNSLKYTSTLKLR